MRKAKVFVKGVEAGILTELMQNTAYLFEYHEEYDGPAVSRTMPVKVKVYNSMSSRHFSMAYYLKDFNWKGC